MIVACVSGPSKVQWPTRPFANVDYISDASMIVRRRVVILVFVGSAEAPDISLL